MQVGIEEFSCIDFKTIEFCRGLDSKEFPTGSLSVINGIAGKRILMRFENEKKLAFAHLKGFPIGKSLTIFNSYRDEKAQVVMTEELNRMHIQVGKIKKVVIVKVDFCNYYEALVNVAFEKGKASIQCLIPKVASTFSLDSRKVLVLKNLKSECISDYFNAHILCSEDEHGYWTPFVLTDDSIAVGTKAMF